MLTAQQIASLARELARIRTMSELSVDETRTLEEAEVLLNELAIRSLESQPDD